MHHVYTIGRAARELGISPNHLFSLSILGQGPKVQQELATCGSIVILAGRAREGHGAAITRGHPMHGRGPPAAGLAEGLGAVF
jgi:hypothetical protein